MLYDLVKETYFKYFGSGYSRIDSWNLALEELAKLGYDRHEIADNIRRVDKERIAKKKDKIRKEVRRELMHRGPMISTEFEFLDRIKEILLASAQVSRGSKGYECVNKVLTADKIFKLKEEGEALFDSFVDPIYAFELNYGEHSAYKIREEFVMKYALHSVMAECKIYPPVDIREIIEDIVEKYNA